MSSGEALFIKNVESILTSISTRKDGSLRIVFETNELKADEALTLLKMRNSFVYVTLAEQPREDYELPPTIKKEVVDGKSYSERLRSHIYVYWKKIKSLLHFESFYQRQMEIFINAIKAEIKKEEEKEEKANFLTN